MSDHAFTSSRSGDFATARRGRMDAIDLAFVRDRLAQGQPLSAIAKMVQRPATELLAKFEPPPQRPTWQPPPPPPAPSSTYRAAQSFAFSAELIAWGRCPSDPSRTMRKIATDVAREHGLTLDHLRGPQKARQFAWPRQEAMWRMYKTGRFSLPQIGRFLGKRDHTTILYGIRAYQARVDAGKAK